MIVNYYGTIVKGSSDIETSIAEQEILPSGNSFVNFSLLNDQNCHISINNSDYIYIRANQGILVSVANSVKIQEDNITYNWNGTVR